MPSVHYDQQGDVTLSEEDGVVTVRLHRPAKRNAISPVMTAALAEAVTRLGDREDLRVMVISAAGDYFTAGIDLAAPPGFVDGVRMKSDIAYRRGYRRHHLLYDEIETIEKPVASTPKFSPVAGIYAPNTIVKLTSATAGATIYYTTTGTAPTTASTRYPAAGIKLTKTTTIEAMAVAAGHTNSPVGSATFTIKPAAPKPVFHPGTESFTTSATVKLTDTATAGLAIYYTVNGAAPTTASTKYTATGIKVTKTETIRAIAIATGYSKSAVALATYTLK